MVQANISPTLAQITDLHIGSGWNENAQRLETIIQSINKEVSPFLTLITGDLVQEGTIKAYEYLRRLLEHLEAPYYIIPGNHDNRVVLKQVFNGMTYVNNKDERIDYCIDIPQLPFKLLALDTVVPGKFYGQLSEEQLQKIIEVCQETSKPLVIFMHHPPLTVETIDPFTLQYFREFLSELLEGLQFIGAKTFAAKIPYLPSLCAILSGHLHLSAQLSWQGISLIIAPSAAPPLKGALPYKEHLSHVGMFLHKNPGFAVHQWDPNANNFITSFQECHLKHHVDKCVSLND